jgi:CO dehydrogenase/acetyl-CoA synthase alpha subunit
MSLDGANLVKRGSAAAGEQATPVIAQYQVSAVKGLASTAIHPADYSQQVILNGPVMNITGHVQPGGTGVPLVDGTIQNATDTVCNSNPLGNTLASSSRPTTLGDPIVNPAQVETAGLSLAPQTE